MLIYEKICPRCNLCKPFYEFYKNRNRYDGVTKDCKICHRKFRKPTELDLLRQKIEFDSGIYWNAKKKKNIYN